MCYFHHSQVLQYITPNDHMSNSHCDVVDGDNLSSAIMHVYRASVLLSSRVFFSCVDAVNKFGPHRRLGVGRKRPWQCAEASVMSQLWHINSGSVDAVQQDLEIDDHMSLIRTNVVSPANSGLDT